MKRNRVFLTGLMAAACVSVATMAAWARHHDPAVWTADKTLISQLSEQPSNFSDYQIQAPPNWDPQTVGGPGKIGTEFDGPTDAGGNHPFLEVLAMGLPDWGIDKRTPADFLSLRIGNVKRMVTDWQPSKYESGVINGVPFARCYWTGTTMQSHNKVKGFMYVGRCDPYVIEIQGAESIDKASQTLPLLEAAVMTFQKRLKPLV